MTILTKQKQEGLYSVYLHPIGGQLLVKDLRTILDLIEKFKNVEIRLSMSESAYFRNLNGTEAEELLKLTEKMSAKTDFEQSVSCIGVPTCQVGLCNSQGTLHDVLNYFKDNNARLDILPKIHFSGCWNSCGVHQISGIGFTGKKKRVGDAVEECFTLFVNGAYGIEKTRLGEPYADIQSSRIPEFLFRISKKVQESELSFEEYLTNKADEFKGLVEEYSV